MILKLEILILSFVFLYSCERFQIPNISFKIDSVQYDIKNFNELDSTFNKHLYTIEYIDSTKEIPPIYLNSIAESIKQTKKREKKENFIRILLSHTLKVNEEINKVRIKLYRVMNQDIFNRKDSIWLDSLSSEFRVRNQNYTQLFNKIDIIPPSLILVQGIIESGWATSKYAVEGNNIFGLHGSKGKRSIKAKYSNVRLQAFDSIRDCVREYMYNLNRNGSYKRLRKLRADMRRKGLKITGKQLAGTLLKYSENGESYVRKIISMINYYDLEDFDDYKLQDGVEIYINIQS